MTDFIRIKYLWSFKNTTKWKNRQNTNWKKSQQYLDIKKILYSKCIDNYYNSMINKHITQYKQKFKTNSLHKHLFKVNKHMERCS